MEIKNKVIIVTGASAGIGLAVAKHLNKLGAKLVLAARTIDSVDVEGFKIKTDMRNHSDVKNLVKKTVEKFGRIDILINNAGQGMMGDVEDINIDDYRKIMELNVFSVVDAMQQVIPIMRSQKYGMIINVSSRVSKMVIPGLSAYSSTKYALNAITLIAREELAKDKIVVSLVHPKLTSTDFMKNAINNQAWGGSASKMAGDPPELVAKKVEEIIKSEEPEIMV